MEPGTQIGPYRVEALIGQGGMATVHRVWHTGLHRHEALKLLARHMTYDRVFVERFLAEARTAAGLHHPNIVALHNVSTPDVEIPYFTMELIDGGDLANLLQRRGRLTLSETVTLLSQVAKALDYAHSRGVVHRDVKPANILLHKDSTGLTAKIVDFGIARAQESGATRLTKAGMIVGTPEYISPEQGGSGALVDERTDQYSLAVIAYEMLCGRPPFVAGTGGSSMTVLLSHIRETPPAPTIFTPTLPIHTASILLRALSKDPKARFANCSEFVATLLWPRTGGSNRLVVKSYPVTHSSRAGYSTAGSIQNRTNTILPVTAAVLALSGVVLVSTLVLHTHAKINAVHAALIDTAAKPRLIKRASISHSLQRAREYALLAKNSVDAVSAALKSFSNHPLSEHQALLARERMQRQCQVALAHSSQAIALDPANSLAWEQQVRALRLLGQDQEADAARTRGLSLNPNDIVLRDL